MILFINVSSEAVIVYLTLWVQAMDCDCHAYWASCILRLRRRYTMLRSGRHMMKKGADSRKRFEPRHLAALFHIIIIGSHNDKALMAHSASDTGLSGSTATAATVSPNHIQSSSDRVP